MSRNISGKVKKFVFEREQGKCVYCGSTEKLEFDHIIPASKGGSNFEGNIQLVCMDCNRAKYKYLDDDFLRDPNFKKKRRLKSYRHKRKITIPKELFTKLNWKYGERISALYEIYNERNAISMRKNRNSGVSLVFQMEEPGVGFVFLPSRMLNALLYSIQKDITENYNLRIRNIKGHKELFLFKKEKD
ncbi:hypothetical protein LCGC14_0506440 [marine sediment metagenome]|uniref:HNH nuclease domain-containing protein n=1 Tax=marine sediment metagenome TaxID=412755 RepID=A0A0F9S7G5_9ZZZZ